MSKLKKRAGGPRTKRPIKITIMVSTDEFRALQELADREARSMSDAARRAWMQA